ncbi:hypothetical protein ACOBQB_18510 [Streptomyces sp. G5(2025)]|uniref:hypothetical protein n=1 Tax=Streptomyces sp. G5(2025) TaxID=3406628 RepID=UPI003C20AF46
MPPAHGAARAKAAEPGQPGPGQPGPEQPGPEQPGVLAALRQRPTVLFTDLVHRQRYSTLPVTPALRRRTPLRVIGAGRLLVGAGYAVLALGNRTRHRRGHDAAAHRGEIQDTGQGRFPSLYPGVSVSGVVLSAPLGGALHTVAPGQLWVGVRGARGGAGADP